MNLKSWIEKYSFGVCQYLSASLGVTATRVRLYFIYASFATFGSTIIVYLFLSFWLSIRKYIREYGQVIHL